VGAGLGSSMLHSHFAGERLVAGPSPMGPGWAQLEETTWSSHPVDPPPAGTIIGVGCYVDRAAGQAGGLGEAIPDSIDEL